MTPERWGRIKDLFGAALEYEPSDRSAFLEREAGAEPELVGEVEALLLHSDTPGAFLDRQLPWPALFNTVLSGWNNPVSIEAARCPTCGADLSAGGECSRCVPRPALGQPAGDLTAKIAGASAFSSEPGQLFGPYRTLSVLGEGGMGIVYLAEQQEPIRRRVALKVIKLGMDSKEVIARFESERQALALLDHPNIARVLDANTRENGRPYFVMEYVPGIPIGDYCDQHRLSSRERLELFCQVCQAIHHAHQKGVIHRDIKPSNILVEVREGKPLPKVIDFGMAKAISQRLTEKTLFTEMGMLIGTPAYMSPEQTAATPMGVDTTTDIYSLGVVLYELLVGALPFDSAELRKAGYAEICRVIREDEPPRPTTKLQTLGAEAADVARRRHTDVRTLAREVRGDLDRIAMKALEKDRTRRYASASELAADIGRHLRDEPVLASPPGAMYRMHKFARKHKGPMSAVLAVAVVLVVGLVVSTALYLRAERERREAQWQSYVAIIRAANMAIDKGDARTAKEQLLKCEPSLRAWEWRYLWRRADSSLVTLYAKAHPQDRFTIYKQSLFALSSDGRRIYWSGGETLSVWDAATYQPAATYGGFGEILALRKDGARILARRSDILSVVDPASGVIVTKLDLPEEDARLVKVAAFAPDGNRVAIGCYDLPPARGGSSNSCRDGTLSIWDLASGRLVVKLNRESSISAIAFSPDGRLVAAGLGCGGCLGSASDRKVFVWGTTTGKLVSTIDGRGYVYALTFNSDGSRIAGVVGREVGVWNAATGKPSGEPLSGHSNLAVAVAFSPDGERIASAALDRTVRIWGVSGWRLATLFGNSDGVISSVAFSSDGTRLFSASQSGEIRVWNATTLGGSRLRNTKAIITSIAVSPDGTRVVTSDFRRISFDDLRLGGVIQISDPWSGKRLFEWQAGSVNPPCESLLCLPVAFSPDGLQFALGSTNGDVRLWDAKSGRALATLQGHTSAVNTLAFSPRGTYLVSGSLDRTVRVWELAAGRTVKSESLPDPVDVAVFDPSGERILIGLGDLTKPASNIHDSSALIWSPFNGAPLRKLTNPNNSGWVISAAWSLDGSLAAATSAGRVLIWPKSFSEPPRELSAANPDTISVAFSPDGMRLIGSSNNGLHVWDARRYEHILDIGETAESNARVIVFSRDGTRAFSLMASEVRIWETRSAYDPARSNLSSGLQKSWPSPVR